MVRSPMTLQRWAIVFLVLVASGGWHPVHGNPEDGAPVTDPPRVPPPILRTHPTRIAVDIETREVRAEIADGVSYDYWVYGQTVPGPFIRVRQGDTIELTLRNAEESLFPHSIDLHAVTGQGGGAAFTQALPGEKKGFVWKALNPGLYVYHCATPPVPTHVANGMYGLILVEPPGGLPKVDREFYVVQGDFYTEGDHGDKGYQPYSLRKARAEEPEYVVFNGREGSLTGKHALKVNAGETVRIYVGNGGPNLISSFHIIGEIFDRVYPEGAIGGGIQENIQTTLIPAGGAAIVELTVDLPGEFFLVDHSLFRAFDKGAFGILRAVGEERPDIYRPLDAGKK